MDREIHQGSLALRWAVCRSERGQVGAWKGPLGAGREQIGAGRGQLGAGRGQVGATKPGHGAAPSQKRLGRTLDRHVEIYFGLFETCMGFKGPQMYPKYRRL